MNFSIPKNLIPKITPAELAAIINAVAAVISLLEKFPTTSPKKKKKKTRSR